MSKQQKTCTKCKTTYNDINKMFYTLNIAEGNYECYCKPCKIKYNIRRNGLIACKEWVLDGFDNEQDHFNAAIKEYSRIFEMPSLLKHIK